LATTALVSDCVLYRCRLRSKCKKCPETAWLMFFLFSMVIAGLVAASVYMSKRRINLACLGIGVVCSDCGCIRECVVMGIA
jgi:hypothetical protein